MFDGERMKTVAALTSAQDAHLLRIRLESQGIQAEVCDEATTSVAPFYTQAIGGIRVQVSDEDLAKAKAILEEPVAEVDLREGVTCPKCNSANIAKDLDKDRSYFTSFLVSILMMLPVPLVRRRYKCNDCNHLWK